MRKTDNPWHRINLWIATLPTNEERVYASRLMPLTSALVEAQREFGGPPMILYQLRELVQTMESVR